LDGNSGAALAQVGAGVNIAQEVGVATTGSCGKSTNYVAGGSCLNPAAFANTGATGFQYSQFPTQTRNQFRGPGYTDFDMGLYKTFSVKERFNFGLGATAFNVFNHPNFNLPGNTVGGPFFGQQWTMQGVPSSPYGNFLGFDSSVRVVQLSLKLTF
jgi:hypothetical protein